MTIIMKLGNIDSTILIEKPKIAPYKQQMEKNIAEILKCDVSKVNVKATRGEKLGFVGKEKRCSSTSYCLIKERIMLNMYTYKVNVEDMKSKHDAKY